MEKTQVKNIVESVNEWLNNEWLKERRVYNKDFLNYCTAQNVVRIIDEKINLALLNARLIDGAILPTSEDYPAASEWIRAPYTVTIEDDDDSIILSMFYNGEFRPVLRFHLKMETIPDGASLREFVHSISVDYVDADRFVVDYFTHAANENMKDEPDPVRRWLKIPEGVALKHIICPRCAHELRYEERCDYCKWESQYGHRTFSNLMAFVEAEHRFVEENGLLPEWLEWYNSNVNVQKDDCGDYYNEWEDYEEYEEDWEETED